MGQNLIQEVNNGGLSGHFGMDKTCALVDECYSRPQIVKNMKNSDESCRICQHAKERSQTTRLYTPLPILEAPWEYINMVFELGFPRT
jgi:hypothetical protein